MIITLSAALLIDSRRITKFASDGGKIEERLAGEAVQEIVRSVGDDPFGGVAAAIGIHIRPGARKPAHHALRGRRRSARPFARRQSPDRPQASLLTIANVDASACRAPALYSRSMNCRSSRRSGAYRKGITLPERRERPRRVGVRRQASITPERTAIGIRIRPGEDQVRLRASPRVPPAAPRILRGRQAPERRRMEGDHKIPRRKTNPSRRANSSRLISSRRRYNRCPTADQQDPLRVLAELHHPPGDLLRGNEVEMRHLGDRVADRLVERAFRPLSAAEVRHRNARRHAAADAARISNRSPRSTTRLGSQPVQRIRETDLVPRPSASPRLPAESGGQQHLDLGVR